jgi:hypothetical protein
MRHVHNHNVLLTLHYTIRQFCCSREWPCLMNLGATTETVCVCVYVCTTQALSPSYPLPPLPSAPLPPAPSPTQKEHPALYLTIYLFIPAENPGAAPCEGWRNALRVQAAGGRAYVCVSVCCVCAYVCMCLCICMYLCIYVSVSERMPTIRPISETLADTANPANPAERSRHAHPIALAQARWLSCGLPRS